MGEEEIGGERQAKGRALILAAGEVQLRWSHSLDYLGLTWCTCKCRVVHL